MLSNNFPYDPNVVVEYVPRLWQAALVTLQITTMGILVGLLLGLIIAMMRISRHKFLQYPAKAYIWAVRGTPLLLQLWIVYYGLAGIIKIPAWPSAIFALAVHNAAYIAEIFRGAIQSIDRGQQEAAMSLGMTPWQSMKRIILPQSFKRAVPPLGNQFIIALKDSSLASTITVPELMHRSRAYASSTFMYLEILVAAGIYYLLLTSILTVLVGNIEERLRVSEYRS